MLSTISVTGVPNWIDLGSPDTAVAAAFYEAVFGWTFHVQAAGYGFLQKEGKTVAALGPLTEEGASSAWTVYFHTPDSEATSRDVKDGGGTVRVEPIDLQGAAWMTAITDPTGAEFGTWQPGALRGLDTASEPGALNWVELHTSDPEAALAFYRTLFGWRTATLPVPGIDYTGLSLAQGDQEETSFGGVVQAQPDQASRWLPYFESADADDTATKVEKNGGTVLTAPVTLPGIGRIALLADPSAAPFYVITPA